jgi:hypothetical protein
MSISDQPAAAGRLSQDEVSDILEQLSRDGFVVLRGVVSKEPLEEFRQFLLAEYERAQSSGALFRGGGTIIGHLNCFPGERSRFIYDDIRDYGIVDVAEARDPIGARYPRPTLNFNLPNSVAQHYHMDGIYTREFLICNVAVVDTDIENGAFDVLPGTHSEFQKFWRYALERKYRLSTRVPLEQGDAILRLSTTWHRGAPNMTSTPRPMMAITFGELGPTSGDPFTHNGGEVEFYENWYSTSRLGQLREHTYRVAPITYSAYRFVRSLWGNKGYSSW